LTFLFHLTIGGLQLLQRLKPARNHLRGLLTQLLLLLTNTTETSHRLLESLFRLLSLSSQTILFTCNTGI
jgi:hypothetical protein